MPVNIFAANRYAQTKLGEWRTFVALSGKETRLEDPGRGTKGHSMGSLAKVEVCCYQGLLLSAHQACITDARSDQKSTSIVASSTGLPLLCLCI